MSRECTEFFMHYREIARLVWNLGFRSKPELLKWASERAYDEAMARLFEGMILRPLGYEGRIELTFYPGKIAPFFVSAKTSGVQLLVDKNLPNEPAHIWGIPTIKLGSEAYRLRFISFFDWDPFAARDLRLLKVSIEQMEGRSDVIGRYALIDLGECSVWLQEDIPGEVESEG